MTTIQIAFVLFAIALFAGLFMPSPPCLAIALALGVALYLEHREHRRSSGR